MFVIIPNIFRGIFNNLKNIVFKSEKRKYPVEISTIKIWMLWKSAVTFFFAIDTFLVLLTNLDIVFCKLIRVFNFFFLFCPLRYLHVIREILILFYHSLLFPVFCLITLYCRAFLAHHSHYAVALIYKGGEVDKIRNKQNQYPLMLLK